MLINLYFTLNLFKTRFEPEIHFNLEYNVFVGKFRVRNLLFILKLTRQKLMQKCEITSAHFWKYRFWYNSWYFVDINRTYRNLFLPYPSGQTGLLPVKTSSVAAIYFNVAWRHLKSTKNRINFKYLFLVRLRKKYHNSVYLVHSS